ncbi:MAG: hypothetical protein IPK09_00045 [Candidatus Competibacteraceae bacterium]|nr:hypothetical protein [Candidatus Competibacteraceae bacterium]
MTLLLVGCALSALLFYRTGYPQADLLQRILALLVLLGSLINWRWSARKQRASEPKRIDVE